MFVVVHDGYYSFRKLDNSNLTRIRYFAFNFFLLFFRRTLYICILSSHRFQMFRDNKYRYSFYFVIFSKHFHEFA